MRKNNPIPKRLLADFMGYMAAAENDDLPDGAWFAVLEGAAEDFMGTHRLRGCPNSATHQYLSNFQASKGGGKP